MACDDCNNEIHENDIGTEFIATIVKCVNGVDTPIDISTATDLKIIFSNPLGTATAYNAVFTLPSSGGAGNGTDGKISYFTLDQNLVPVGQYQIQGQVTTPAGKWSSSIEIFTVERNLLSL